MPKFDRTKKIRTVKVYFDGRILKSIDTHVTTDKNCCLQIRTPKGVKLQAKRNSAVNVLLTDTLEKRKTPVQYTLTTGEIEQGHANTFEVHVPDGTSLVKGKNYSVQFPKEALNGRSILNLLGIELKK